MHLALVSEFNVHDIRSWSGIPWAIVTALRGHVERLSVVSPLPNPASPAQRLRQLRARVRGERFLRQHTAESARRTGAFASARLAEIAPDAVLSIGSTPVGFLETDAPVAFWSDATFESNLYFYDGYAGLAADNVAEGHAVEQRAQDRAALALYASEFAARSARGYYGTPAGRVGVVPFGANLTDEPAAAAVRQSIEDRATDSATLLFLGADWVRKGGDLAARAAAELRRRGVEAQLVVAGPEVPEADRGPHVREMGYLDKRTPEGRAAFDALLAQSQFLVLPSRAEAFGCVFCEAAAYGVPSIAPALGGMPTAVADGINGVLVPPHPTPAEIADRVQALLADPPAYRALCHSARDRYERELTWDAATRDVVARIEALR